MQDTFYAIFNQAYYAIGAAMGEHREHPPPEIGKIVVENDVISQGCF